MKMSVRQNLSQLCNAICSVPNLNFHPDTSRSDSQSQTCVSQNVNACFIATQFINGIRNLLPDPGMLVNWKCGEKIRRIVNKIVRSFI